jgi:hypothetical protein
LLHDYDFSNSQIFLSPPKWNFIPPKFPPPSSSGNHYSNFLSTWFYLFCILHINGSIWYVAYCIWFLLFIVSRLIWMCQFFILFYDWIYYINISHFVCQLVSWWTFEFFSLFWLLLQILLLWTFMDKFMCKCMFPLSWVYNLGVEVLGHVEILCLTLFVGKMSVGNQTRNFRRVWQVLYHWSIAQALVYWDKLSLAQSYLELTL